MCASGEGFCALRGVLTLALGLADQGGALSVKQIVPDSVSASYDDVSLFERHRVDLQQPELSALHNPHFESRHESSLIAPAAISMLTCPIREYREGSIQARCEGY